MTSVRKTKAELVAEIAELRRQLEAQQQLGSQATRPPADEPSQVFRLFVEASGQGFGMADLDGYITYWNPALCRFFGEDTPANAVGKHVTEYYPADYFDRRQKEILPAILRGEHWQGELVLQSRQGRTTHVLQNAFLVYDSCGQPFRLATVFTDITERERAAELLRQSLDEIRAIYENMGDGLLIADQETMRLLRANPSICSLLGYTEAELLTRCLADLHPPDVLAMLLAPLAQRGGPHYPFRSDVPTICRDGSVLYFDISGNRVTYNGRPCLLGVFRDATGRREAQAALERERQTLWHMLQASDHERQLIAYEIHDGLAQLLTGAMMQYQAFEHLRANQPDKAGMAFAMGYEMLQMAHAEARRLISGVRPPVLDEAGVETAIAHLVHDRRLTKGPEIEYQSNVEFTRLPRILENALYRIAQESLTNACRHSQSAKIRVHLHQACQKVLLEVRDWGVGFDLNAIPPGHFGLEGIRERVRLLGGQLKIDTAPGCGTLLRVELPLLTAESA